MRAGGGAVAGNREVEALVVDVGLARYKNVGAALCIQGVVLPACMGRWVIGSQSLRLYREITDDARDAWATLCAAPAPARVTLSFEELRQVAIGTARSAAQKGEVIAADVQLSESESDSD